MTSRDLRHWDSISSLEGKNIASIATSGDEIWVGGEGRIYRISGLRISREYSIGDGRVVNLFVDGDEVLFKLIRDVPPPSGYCSPFFELSALQALDIGTGEVTKAPAVSSTRPQEANSLVPRWRTATAVHPLDFSAFKDALEAYFKAEGTLIYYPFWNGVIPALLADEEYERLKRMFSKTNPHGRRWILVYGARGPDSFAKDLLTLAVDRKDYLGEDLVRTIARQEGEFFNRLLLRVLREGASDKQDPRITSSPYPFPSGYATDALLARKADLAIPDIEAVMEDASTNPLVRASLKKRLSNWHYSNKKRSYQPPQLRKALKATGSEAVALLDDSDPTVRFQALQRLQGEPDSIPFAKLSKLLNDRSDVGPLAAKLLGFSQHPKAADALLNALESPSIAIRTWALISLGRLRSPSAYPALIRGLKDERGDIRSGASKGLGLLGDKKSVPALIEAAGKTGGRYDYGVEGSARALGELGDLRAVPVLMKNLKSDHMGIRLVSAEALGKLRAQEAVPDLISALGDDSPQVRREAIWALGKIGDPTAIAPLEQMNELDSFTRRAIERTIQRLRRKGDVQGQ